MRRPWLARRILAPAIIGLLAAAPLLTASPGDAATPGTWGVQQAAYVDGTVCSEGGVTSPLAAWDFGDNGLDFLTDPVTSTGFTDSALLPQAGAPGRLTSPVSPGTDGMSSATDISTYAALISIFGSGPDPDAQEVAKAILDVASGTGTPNCVSAAAAQALTAQAAHVAGPYTITATPATSPIAAGATDSLIVHVTNTFGQPAPGVAVTVTSPEAIFSGTETTTAHTDATGMARVGFTVPQDNLLTTLPISASASVSVGLEAVTAGGEFGQKYASAIFADPATPYTANVTLPVSQGAAPVLTSKLSATAITKDSSLTLSEQLTGMFGHTGHVTFSILGPLKLDPTTLCSALTPQSFSGHAPTAASSNLDVTGDSTLTGGTWTPSSVGCYLLQSQIVTTNATPQATARGPLTILTVIDTTATATPQHTVIGPGSAVSESVVVANSYQRSGTVATTMRGPIDPGDGDCQRADWTKVKSTSVTSTTTKGDGTYTVATAALTKAGCYQIRSELQLAVAAHSTADIPLTSPVANGIFYVLQPTVSASAMATSVVSPARVKASVTVLNTFGQDGKLSLQMLVAASTEFGCRAANFAGAQVVATGPAVATTGDGTVTVTSAATSKLGCYALVPKLVMDANSAVVATGTPGGDNVVLAGVGIEPPAPRAKATVGRSLVSTYVTFAAFLIVLLGTAFAVLRYVTQTYAHDDEGEDDGRPSPLGSWLNSLFSNPTGRT